jgi:ribose/xylose/arabinose/galactoside ABC-type transport system permease subunit
MGSRARIGWVLLFMALVLGIASPGFWDLRNLLNLLQQSGVTAILGIGLTFVILTGGIDLSVGSVLALAGVCAASVAVSTGSTALAILAGVAVGAAAGFVNGWVTTRGRIPSFIATLGMMMVARSAAKVFTDAKPISGLPDGFRSLASEPLGLSLIVWLAVALYGVAHLVLTRTKLGRYTYAIGGNERAAWISGVPIERTKVVVYTLSGAMAGLAAVLLTARLNSASPLTGEMYELYAIAAAVIGGVSLTGGQGRVGGTFVGALIMALLRNGLNSLDVPSAWEGIVVGGVVVGAAIVDRVEHRADGQREARPWIQTRRDRRRGRGLTVGRLRRADASRGGRAHDIHRGVHSKGVEFPLSG